jgi:hypothetical protein
MRQILANDFDKINVVIVDVYNMTCTHRTKGFDVTMGNYTLIDEFCVVDIAYTHVVLGVQWLYS